MSRVREDILSHAHSEHRECLLWLLENYRWASKFHFVVDVSFKPYGPYFHQQHRVYRPTPEGWLLWKHREELQCLKTAAQ